MTDDHVFLLNKSFEVERSKISIKIENFDIEYKPITAEIESQTVDSELLGRIDKNIEAKEPKIETADVGLVASEPVIERIEKCSLAEEPKPEIVDVAVHAEEPKVIRSDVGLAPVFPEVAKLEKETITDENSNSKRDVATEMVDELESELDSEENPLLEEIPDPSYELEDGGLSSLSSSEFGLNDEGFSTLNEGDPKSILTWNVSGLQNTMSKRTVWEPFLQLLKQHDPDIVILQDVKLCSSKILGVVPRLSMRVFGGHVTPSYGQEVQDADLVVKLQRTTFKNYYCIHSLSSWRVAGQLVFIKKQFEEGRSIIVQFKSFYLLSLLSPLQGWVNRSVEMRNKWDRELARFLDNSKREKATIISGNLNCAPEDIDLSHPEKLKMEKSVVLYKQDEVGFPGSRDIDRIGYYLITKAGNLTDVFRHKHPYDGTEKRKKNIKYTTLAFLSDRTRCAVRTNLVLMSNKFLNNVKLCEIIGRTEDLDPSGWRHLPQLLKLEKSQ